MAPSSPANLQNHGISTGRQKVRTCISLFLLFITLATVAAFAHGDEQHIMGTVTAISGNSITVHTTAKPPKDVTVLVVASTQFVRSGAAASLQDLKVGDRVVIHAKPNADKKLEASMVEFGKSANGKIAKIGSHSV